jgi:putative glutamine amidotransferase
MKKIGIVGWSTGDNSFGCTKPYLQWLQNFGFVQILLPNKEIINDLDLIVMPGGADVSSHYYKQAPSLHNTNADVFKEYFFKNNLPKYIANGTPIFGICLGMQQLCVHFGATMIQHLHGNHEYSWESRDQLVHQVKVTPDYIDLLLPKQRTKGTIKTNSLHHQAVATKEFPECLDIVATSWDEKNPGKGVLEAVKHKELPIYGVQYHPEEIYDSLSYNMVLQLLNK